MKKTESIRTRLDDNALRQAVGTLKDVVTALEAVLAGTATMTEACKAEGLDYLKVRQVLLTSSFANCRLGKPPVTLGNAVSLGPDPCEKLYMDVFGIEDIGSVQLPPDYQDTVPDVLGTLTEREQKVLRMRYGLDGGFPMILKEIGDEIGVGQERIRQIEAKALRKLRHPSRAKWMEQGNIRHRAEQEATRAAVKAQEEAVATWLAEQKEKAASEAGSLDVQEFSAAQIGLDEMDLSVRSYNCLKRAGKDTFLDVLQMTEDDLAKVRNLGKMGVAEVLYQRDAMLGRIRKGA